MDSFLALFGPQDQPWLAPALAGAIILISLLSALLFHKLLFRLILRITQWTPTDLDTRMVRATRWPLTLGIVVLGGYLALTVPLELTEGQQSAANKGFGLLGIVLGIIAVVGVVSRNIDWYLETLETRTQLVVDARLIPLLRRGAVVLVYGIGGLLIIDLFGFSISPLIAGLGLGGLAVALAIQPTLANLFAGTYVMTEGVVSPGDYVELDGGMTGYVVEVGWRSTRIRNWRNNLVVVPNSKFAETIITNYQRPAPAVNVWLTCGVSYDSDLDQVEKICHEVMNEVLDTEPTGVKEYGTWFAFDGFGDSNVTFWLFIQATDRWGAYQLQSALIKALHRRLKQEGIAINYPMRTLEFPKEWSADTMPRLGGNHHAARSNGRDQRRRGRRRRVPKDVSVPRNDGAGETNG